MASRCISSDPISSQEPLRGLVLANVPKLPTGGDCFVGRPGAEMADFDFAATTELLNEECAFQYDGLHDVSRQDVLSYAMYPQVFKEFSSFREAYGDVSLLDTRTFVRGLTKGKEIRLELEKGKDVFVELLYVSEVDTSTGVREVGFNVNGFERFVGKLRDEAFSNFTEI